MRAMVSGAVVVCLLAAGAAQLRGQSANAEVRQLADTYSSAWASGDAKTIAAMFEPEGVMVGGFADVSAGRGQIEQNLAKSFAGVFKGSKIRLVPEGTRQVGADTLVTVGSYEITGATGTNGEPLNIRGRFLNTLVRKDGKLLVAASASNVALPQRR
jgi:uncharacterized protein (TIGR02246 family)